MTLAAKLVNKAIYLQILQRTDSEDILLTYVRRHARPLLARRARCRFLKHDGHRILLKWLTHFAREQNHAFLLDTLHLLGHLPFNVDRVSQNDLDELQLKVAELASAESGEAKGQCLTNPATDDASRERRKDQASLVRAAIGILNETRHFALFLEHTRRRACPIVRSSLF